MPREGELEGDQQGALALLERQPGFKGHVGRPDKDEAVAALPLPTGGFVLVDAADYVGFIEDVHDALVPAIGTKGYDPKTGPPGADFVDGKRMARMFAPSGYPMFPLATPPRRVWSECPSLADGASPAHPIVAGVAQGCLEQNDLDLLDAVAACAHEGLAETDAVVPIDSSTGGPHWTTLPQWKQHLIRVASMVWMILARCGMAPLIMLALMVRFGALALTSMGERSQADAPGKQRAIFDFDDQDVYANKTLRRGLLREDGNILGLTKHKWGRRRRRHVNSVGAGLHTFELFLMSLVQAYALTVFAFTWKHTSKQQLQAKMAGWKYALGVDATQFDSTIIRQAGEMCHKHLCRLYDDCLFPILNALDHLPLLLKDGQGAWRWVGNPLDVSTWSAYLGQLSGRPTNPTANRVYGVWLGLIAVDRALRSLGRPGVLPGEVRNILCGRDPRFALLNSGDDMVILTNDEQLAAALRAGLADLSFCPYTKLEYDPAGTFLGWHICSTPYGLTVSPNLVNCAVNYFQPEYGFWSDDRRAASSAWDVRIRYHYGAHPAIQDFRAVVNTVHERRYGYTLEARLRRCPDPVAPENPLIELWPAGIHYGKWTIADVPEAVLRSKYIIIPYADLARATAWCRRARVLTQDELAEVCLSTGADVWLAIKYQQPVMRV